MSDNHTIQRAKHGKSTAYFLMARSTAQDDRLSFEARGILAYLLSKPDTWLVKVKDLQFDYCGRDKVRRILDELAQAGYIEKPQRSRGQDGKWVWSPYLVYETPCTEKPCTEKPSTVEPPTDFQSIYRVKKIETTEGENTEKRKKKKELSTPSVEPLPSIPEGQSTTSRNEYYDAVKETFGMEGALNGLMAGMLKGEATRKGWKECNLTPPVTISELKAWAAWFKQHNPNYMETRPLYVQSSIMAYRANPPKIMVVVPDTPLPPIDPIDPPADPTVRIPVSVEHIRTLKASGVLPADFDETLQLTPAELMKYVQMGGKKK